MQHFGPLLPEVAKQLFAIAASEAAEGRVHKLLRAIIRKRPVRLSNKRLISDVRLAMKCPQDRRAAKGHSQVIFDEPSSPRTSDSDDDE
jgi:hypothetical protein